MSRRLCSTQSTRRHCLVVAITKCPRSRSLRSATRGRTCPFGSVLLCPPAFIGSFRLFCSQKLLRSPRKPARKISKIPFKVLDAPELQDDFYLNLVDWSAGNLLSVGLGACVYLWSACTSQVRGGASLCDVIPEPSHLMSSNCVEPGDEVV